MTEWQRVDDDTPRDQWLIVIWQSPYSDHRIAALGCFDGAFWRADGHRIPSRWNDYRPTWWTEINYPDDWPIAE